MSLDNTLAPWVGPGCCFWQRVGNLRWGL